MPMDNSNSWQVKMKDIYGFFDWKIWKYLKTDAHEHKTTINPSDLFLAQSHNWKPLFEVILVRILLKQLDYSLSISMRW